MDPGFVFCEVVFLFVSLDATAAHIFNVVFVLAMYLLVNLLFIFSDSMSSICGKHI